MATSKRVESWVVTDEFWQRVDARNKDTANLLDKLGLAEYFAMEAYVVA